MASLKDAFASSAARCDPANDRTVIAAAAQRARVRPPITVVPRAVLPDQVDLSKYLFFIRCQDGMGCWGYSSTAMWDIMNEMSCPYSPTLSMRIPLMIFRWKNIWEPKGGLFLPDGRWVASPDDPPGEFERLVGMTTEGTEPTNHHYNEWDLEAGWSREGLNEMSNYRWASEWIPVTISSTSFMNQLAAGHPIRLCILSEGWGHFVAVVGYDRPAQTIKIVDSCGDKAHVAGFYALSFQQIDANEADGVRLEHAETFDVVAPRPVPAARIRVMHHDDRANVHLWLNVENSPLPRRKIWPHGGNDRWPSGWNDNSRNLEFVVRVPSEFVWPPSESNRLVLELYDAAEYSQTGGSLVTFTAAFGGHVIHCPKLAGGPLPFGPRGYVTVTIP